jgi:amidase
VVPSTGYIDHEAGGTIEADVNVLGPIARSAADLELLLDILLRQEGPLVASLAPAPEDVGTLKIAAWLDDPFCPVDAQVLKVTSKTVDQMEAAGMSVDRTARPDIDPMEAFALGAWLVTAAMAQSMRAEELQGAQLDNALAGASHREWLDKHTAREAIRVKWAEFFEEYDAILMPISFVPPFEHNQEGNFGTRTLICNGEERPYADLVRWTILTGMAYLPATTPPIGFVDDGLPVSFQVVGPYGGDYTTIRLAGKIAELAGGYKRPPIA